MFRIAPFCLLFLAYGGVFSGEIRAYFDDSLALAASEVITSSPWLAAEVMALPPWLTAETLALPFGRVDLSEGRTLKFTKDQDGFGAVALPQDRRRKQRAKRHQREAGGSPEWAIQAFLVGEVLLAELSTKREFVLEPVHDGSLLVLSRKRKLDQDGDKVNMFTLQSVLGTYIWDRLDRTAAGWIASALGAQVWITRLWVEGLLDLKFAIDSPVHFTERGISADLRSGQELRVTYRQQQAWLKLGKRGQCVEAQTRGCRIILLRPASGQEDGFKVYFPVMSRRAQASGFTHTEIVEVRKGDLVVVCYPKDPDYPASRIQANLRRALPTMLKIRRTQDALLRGLLKIGLESAPISISLDGERPPAVAAARPLDTRNQRKVKGSEPNAPKTLIAGPLPGPSVNTVDLPSVKPAVNSRIINVDPRADDEKDDEDDDAGQRLAAERKRQQMCLVKCPLGSPSAYPRLHPLGMTRRSFQLSKMIVKDGKVSVEEDYTLYPSTIIVFRRVGGRAVQPHIGPSHYVYDGDYLLLTTSTDTPGSQVLNDDPSLLIELITEGKDAAMQGYLAKGRQPMAIYKVLGR